MFLLPESAKRLKTPLKQVACVVLLASATACSEGESQPSAAPTPPPAVTVVKVEERDVAPSSSFTGRIEAVDKVDLRARVEGFLEQRNFVEGAEVAKGDLLFVIEKAPYQAEIAEIQAAIARAEATLKLANIDVDRQTALVKRQAAAQATLDQATAQQGEARADLMRQQAALEKAQLNLSYTDVTAPVAGRIGRSTFSVGDFVGPTSDALATVVSQDPMYVSFPVSQRELLEVRKNAAAEGTDPKNVSVRVRLADGTTYDQTGKLNFVDVQVDPGTDTVMIRATMPNPDRLLIDQQLVTAIVQMAEPRKQLVVPQQAVQADQGGRFVLVVDAENKVKPTRVELGASVDGTFVVRSGLQAGDQVITEGLQKVRPNQVVSPAEAAGA